MITVFAVLYVKVLLDPIKQNVSIQKTKIEAKDILKETGWADRLSKIEGGDFFYPIEEARLEFKSFDVSDSNDTNYRIFTLPINTKNYDFTCVQAMFESENIIFSYFQDETQVKTDLLLHKDYQESIITQKIQNCRIIN